MSQITVAGNLTRDPELRFTQGGRAMATLSVAVSRRYQVNNEWKEETTFYNVVAWGTLAENVSGSCQKGDRVLVVGRMTSRSYETQQGERRTVWEVVADEIGAAMRWAQVSIDRTQREQGNRSSAGHDQGEAPTYRSDEEPF